MRVNGHLGAGVRGEFAHRRQHGHRHQRSRGPNAATSGVPVFNTAASTAAASDMASSETASRAVVPSGGQTSSSATESSITATPDIATISTPAATPTSAEEPGALDAESVRWMTNYCTTIHPIVVLENLRSEMTAASGNPSKRSAVAVRTFRTVGSALTATAKNLKDAEAPSLTAAGSDLSRLLGNLAKIGTALTADGKKIAAVDPVQKISEFNKVLTSSALDLDKLGPALGKGSGMKFPLAALSEIQRIPSCQGIVSAG